MAERSEMDGKAPSAERDILYDLTSRVSHVETEVQKDHSGWGRLGAAAGLLGLAISIANGAFTFADEAFRKPDDEKAADYNAFKTDIRSIVDINADLNSKSAPGPGNPNPVFAAQAANTKVQSVLQDAERLLRLLGADAKAANGKYYIGSNDYGILSAAAYSGGNLKVASDYADQAVLAADNFHAKSEALRAKAIMQFQIQGLAGVSAAEATLQTALDGLAPRTEYGVPFDRASLYATKSSVEAYGGRCAQAQDSAVKAIDTVSGPDIPLPTRGYIGSMVAGGIIGQQRCLITGFSPAIQAVFRQAMGGSMPPNPSAALPAGPQAAGAPTGAPTAASQQTAVKLTYVCRFDFGPRRGETQSYLGMPNVQPVPVGTPCQDGQGSSGRAE